MKTVVSKDGTAIAFNKSGKGQPVILVTGFVDKPANTQLAELLAPDFTVFNYERRGHGESGDTTPYAVEREVEDLEAIINEAGGSAYVFGSSGNGNFALVAARGLATKIKKLAVWEPPYIVDDTRPPLPKDYKTQLTELLSAGRRGDMIELFFTKAVGMPAEFVAPMRNQPFWAAFEQEAHTLIYDATITGDFSLPTELMASVKEPTLVINGGEAAWPWIRHGVQALVDVLPDAKLRSLEGQPHNVDPAALAPVLKEFYAL